MSQKHFEENKRLKNQIDHLQDDLHHERNKKKSREQMLSDLITEAALQLLTGKAAIVMSEGDSPGSKIICFQMMPAPAAEKPAGDETISE